MTQLDPETALLIGCAQLLADDGIGDWPGIDGAFASDDPDETVITVGALPADRRAVAVVLLNEVPIDVSSTRYFLQAQVAAGGDPADSRPVAAVRDALHLRLHPVMPPGIRVTSLAVQQRNRVGLIGGRWRYHLSFTALAARARAWHGGTY